MSMSASSMPAASRATIWGDWAAYHRPALGGAHGYAFHAEKDREMARRADYGLMVWDGASPGACLNMLRLAAAGSPCVVYDTMRSAKFTLRSLPDWHEMLRNASRDLVGRIEARMTDDERDLANGR
ncbi:hypothetical protein [Shinella sp.]|uniref:hypothetical protein n=1 Tax=Shinella sp. TaxID=1870904 RepID=UPI003F71C695